MVTIAYLNRTAEPLKFPPNKAFRLIRYATSTQNWGETAIVAVSLYTFDRPDKFDKL
jgi:hypothetical protein